MTYRLEPFADAGLTTASLAAAIDRHQRDELPRLQRLWTYYRNPMTLSRPAARDARPYRLGQEVGLPARIVGRDALNLDDRAGRAERVVENDIAWRIQANAEGGLSERARVRAAQLANPTDVRRTPPKWATLGEPPKDAKKVALAATADPRVPPSGTALVRDYKGRVVRVVVLPDGFEYEGERFRSLSAIAKRVTGSHINGFRFFNLERR